MRVVALVVGLFACSDPEVPCDVEGVDCCTADDECLDTYGAAAPFCVEPGATTGYCGECSKNDHCSSIERCYDGVCELANCNTADC